MTHRDRQASTRDRLQGWFRLGACCAAGLAVTVAIAMPANAAKPSRCFDKARMAAHVKSSGLAWEDRGKGVWRVDLRAKNRRFVRVVAVCGRKLITVFAVMAQAKQLQGSEKLFKILLKAAEDYDHIKIAIDSDGDYLVRSDLYTSTFSGNNLAVAAKQIFVTVDTLTPTLRKHLKR